jgi:hypothetical protein
MRSNNLIAVLLLCVLMLFVACNTQSGELFDGSGDIPVYQDKQMELLKEIPLSNNPDSEYQVQKLTYEGKLPLIFFRESNKLLAIDLQSQQLLWTLDLSHLAPDYFGIGISKVFDWSSHLVVHYSDGFLVVNPQTGHVIKDYTWANTGLSNQSKFGMVTAQDTLYLLMGGMIGSGSQVIVCEFDSNAEVFNPIYVNRNGGNNIFYSNGFFYDSISDRLIFPFQMKKDNQQYVHIFMLDRHYGEAEMYPVSSAKYVDRFLPIVFQDQVLYWNSWDFHAFSVSQRKHLYDIVSSKVKVAKHYIFGEPSGSKALMVYDKTTGKRLFSERDSYVLRIRGNVYEHVATGLVAIVSYKFIDIHDVRSGQWLMRTPISDKHFYHPENTFVDNEHNLLYTVDNTSKLLVYHWPFH